MATRNGRSRIFRSRAGAFTVGKGWRKTIGSRLAADGRLTPCRFWLGLDEAKASIAALQIESLWLQQQHTSQSAAYWNADAFKVADGLRVSLTRENATASTASTAAPIKAIMLPTPKPLTVRQGIDRYRQSILSSPTLTDATKHSVACRTKALERSPIAAMPLKDVGVEQLSATVRHWLSCPVAPKTGASISKTSATIIIKTARATFDYLDGIGAWVAPRRFDRIFRLPKNNGSPKISTLDVDELKRLYAHADSRMRLLILLGLNCGFCSMEVATLRRSEIWMDTIRRSRQKTAVEQQWGLWDETIHLLAANLAPINGDDLALQTDGGKPMVYYSPKGHRIDTITHCWQRLAKRSKVAKPFKLLRKTGATMIRSIGGIEVSEAYLAHSEKSMARFYSRADPKRLMDALAELRSQLAPIFDKGN